MGYHNQYAKFNRHEYDPMQLGATVQLITKSNGIPKGDDAKYPEDWEDFLEFCMDAVKAKVGMPKDAPAKIKAAYDNYYAQKNKAKSTRDTVVAKVKKSRSK